LARLPAHQVAVVRLERWLPELCELEWRNVDQAGSRFRIRHGKTPAARPGSPCPRNSWPTLWPPAPWAAPRFV